MTLTNNKNLRNTAGERGFTIVELLIVIIVIGILATLVLIAYNNVQGQARDTKRQSDASSLAKAAEAFKTTSTTNAYPTNTAAGFYSDLNNTTLNPNKTVTVDQTVSNKINTTAPSNSNKDYIQANYCPSGATASTATGMSFVWWSETKGANGTPTVTTGVGC